MSLRSQGNDGKYSYTCKFTDVGVSTTLGTTICTFLVPEQVVMTGLRGRMLLQMPFNMKQAEVPKNVWQNS